ncbi:FG-GAP repeat domain-containing protein [Methylotetracoccus oryzae]|uniref:FG-GAP repeat domain-containing protein n=1 Tax=Methylotetracoccus oryzae TaxID=1919059 RepID=UPI0013A52BB7|nr:VCBS repeat-containing protein [Methylotetracoccus oryzae]
MNTIKTGSFATSPHREAPAGLPVHRGQSLRAAILMALATGAGAVHAGTPQFDTQVPYTVGHTPRAVALVDLNRDGRLDLVSADFRDDRISILLGQAGGTFGAAAGVLVGSTPAPAVRGSRPWNLATGDLNADGKPDVATVNCNSLDVSVLLGDGNGGVLPKTDYPVTTGAQDCPKGIAVGDLNRDGKADLAVAIEVGHALKIMSGNGDGTFGDATEIPGIPDTARPSFVTAADTNRDGILDLFVADQTSAAILEFRGQGNGTFAAPVSHSVGVDPEGIAVGDINRDGILDIITANQGIDGPGNFGTLSVLLGTADGNFTAGPTVAPSLKVRSVVLADVDADGILDVVTGNGVSDAVSVLPGIGDGSFGTRVTMGTGFNANGVAVADLNRDGLPEIATANQGFLGQVTPHDVSILKNLSVKPSAGALQRSANSATGTNPSSIASSDIDRDGILDLIVANRGSNDLSVLKGTRDAAVFGTPGRVTLPAEITEPTFVAVGDYSRDGIQDIAVAGTGGMALMLGDGDGNFVSRRTFTDKSVSAVALVDVDANGMPDIVMANPAEDTVTVYRRGASGNLFPAATYAVGDEPVALKIADLNRDGRLDIVVANRSGNTVSVLSQLRTRQFQLGAQSPAVGTSPQALEIADFNGDGRLDIAVANHDSSDVSVLMRARRGGYRAAVAYDAGAKLTALTAVDLNLDGILDLAMASDDGAARRLRILFGRRKGTFGQAVGVAAGGTLPALVSGDFNGNGVPDLAVASGPRNLISTFFSQ